MLDALCEDGSGSFALQHGLRVVQMDGALFTPGHQGPPPATPVLPPHQLMKAVFRGQGDAARQLHRRVAEVQSEEFDGGGRAERGVDLLRRRSHRQVDGVLVGRRPSHVPRSRRFLDQHFDAGLQCLDESFNVPTARSSLSSSFSRSEAYAWGDFPRFLS